jgi:hypothetical protein
MRRNNTRKESSQDLLPKRSRGYQSAEAEAAYQERVAAFCALIEEIQSSMDFAVGGRGWCYILEKHGLRKGDFAAAQKLINDCRKSGELPLDICAEDSSREAIGLENIDTNNVNEEVQSWIEHLRDYAHENYTPFGFWRDRAVYVEVAVEKLDLRNLFAPVCEEFHVPLTNFKGWYSRAAMMRRFAAKEPRQCVLLICGDHDPGGLRITDKVRKNLEDLSRAVEWSPSPRNLKIIRFGLNDDFIDDNNLTWIDNLETSSGERLDDPRHPDHAKDYVQDYIAQFGIRKCEANALVVAPEIGRELCRDAILEHIPEDAVEKYQRKLDRARKQLQRALRERLS